METFVGLQHFIESWYKTYESQFEHFQLDLVPSFIGRKEIIDSLNSGYNLSIPNDAFMFDISLDEGQAQFETIFVLTYLSAVGGGSIAKIIEGCTPGYNFLAEGRLVIKKNARLVY